MIDWLVGEGGQTIYAYPIRNQEMRGPCCYGNTPAAVEYCCGFIEMRATGFGARGGRGGLRVR